MKTLYLLFLTLISLLLLGCDRQPQEFQHTTLEFGTLIDITVYDTSPETARKAFDRLDSDFALMHKAWSPWVPGSLSRINSLIPTGKPFSVAPSVLPLIKNSIWLTEKTNHLYNPAIGNLINLWQFHRSNEPDIHPPDPAKIKQLVDANPRMEDLHFDGIRMVSDNPAVQLSFGAYAKGYGIELAMNTLEGMGIKNAIINAGGDLKAIGRHGDRPWRIGIRHPRKKDAVIASLEVGDDESVFTSGDYERFYMYKGKRYHHILDPRTGYPTVGTESVTVVYKDAGIADAAATAMFVAGPDGWLDICRNLGITEAMLIDDKGAIHITPALKKRIKLDVDPDTTIITTAPL